MGYDYIIRIACDDESVCNENIKKQYKDLIKNDPNYPDTTTHIIWLSNCNL